jgi:hypothetical protein
MSASTEFGWLGHGVPCRHPLLFPQRISAPRQEVSYADCAPVVTNLPMLVSWQLAAPAVLRDQQDGPASRLGKEALRRRHSSAPLLRRHQVCCLRGRPRLRRPFLGGRPTRFDLLTRPVVVPRFAGGSTVHPALRRRSTASTSSMVFISFLLISYFHVCCELRSALLAMLRFFKSPFMSLIKPRKFDLQLLSHAESASIPAAMLPYETSIFVVIAGMTHVEGN